MAEGKQQRDGARKVRLVDLQPLPGNPRRGDIEAIATSLRELGQFRPVVVNRRDMTVLAGNHTVEAARSLGWSDIRAWMVDADEPTARRIALADNRISELGGYDEAALAAMLAEVDGLELAGTGWDEAEVSRVLDAARAAAEEDEIPPPPAKPSTRLGDLYELDAHRLVCGDCTDQATMTYALGDNTPTLIATDPPYGVDYANVVGGRKNQKKGGWPTISGDARLESGIYDLLVGALRPVPARTLFLWYANTMTFPVFQAVADTGWSFAQQIVWVKNALVFGGSDYQWRHETAIYARRRGSRCYADRTATTVWEFPKTTGALHPTQKPQELFEIPIRNHTRRGEAVYEPFAGAGSAVLAADRLERRCVAVEIDPAYCDVIVERWEHTTGGHARRRR